MGLSMKKTKGGGNKWPYYIAIAVAFVVAIAIVAFLPVEFEVKKLLFFVLLNVFAIGLVFVLNLARRRK